MNEGRRVSELMLERYRLGEVSAEELKFVESELAVNQGLALRLKELEGSDRELKRLYPRLPLRNIELKNTVRFPKKKLIVPLCAAALLLCLLFPSILYLKAQGSRSPSGDIQGYDRLKGSGLKTELALYLKDNTNAEAQKLSDRTLLKEGNTVQLAYTTPPENEYYGVIFSIDGRSELTLHYPYRIGQSPVLAAGKRTFLSESYTLDDAPEMEIFFMVVSKEPLSVEDVLGTASELAKEPEAALAKSGAAFPFYEVEAISIRK